MLLKTLKILSFPGAHLTFCVFVFISLSLSLLSLLLDDDDHDECVQHTKPITHCACVSFVVQLVSKLVSKTWSKSWELLIILSEKRESDSQNTKEWGWYVCGGRRIAATMKKIHTFRYSQGYMYILLSLSHSPFLIINSNIMNVVPDNVDGNGSILSPFLFWCF